MRNAYEVYRGDEPVGTAEVTRKGLYYCIRLKCALSGDVMHKAEVRCNGAREDLGILVPEEGGFVLTTRIPIKRIGAGDMTFRVIPRHKPFRGHFVKLSPEEPFTYLKRLKDAFLVNQNGEIGILFKQK